MYNFGALKLQLFFKNWLELIDFKYVSKKVTQNTTVGYQWATLFMLHVLNSLKKESFVFESGYTVHVARFRFTKKNWLIRIICESGYTVHAASCS